MSVDIAEMLVEIHVLADEGLAGELDRPQLRVVHDWIDHTLDTLTVGRTEEDADTLDGVAELIDAVIAFDLLVPIIGPLLERFDGLVLTEALRWLQRVLRPNPERRARRAEERHEHRLRRRFRRRQRKG